MSAADSPIGSTDSTKVHRVLAQSDFDLHLTLVRYADGLRGSGHGTVTTLGKSSIDPNDDILTLRIRAVKAVDDHHFELVVLSVEDCDEVEAVAPALGVTAR